MSRLTIDAESSSANRGEKPVEPGIITKYEASYRFPSMMNIKRRVFISQTDKSLVDQYGRRTMKESDGVRFVDTWEEAHAILLAMSAENVARARRELELANSYYGNVKGMRAPQ